MQLSLNCIFNSTKQELIFLPEQQVISLSFAETAVLSLLLANQNHVVSKTALETAGWPERIVAGSSLLHCVSQLRKKLETVTNLEIKTIPRHGYCLFLAIKPNTKTPFTANKPVLILLSLIALMMLLWGAFELFNNKSTDRVLYQSSHTVHIDRVAGQLHSYSDSTKPLLPQDVQIILDKQIVNEPDWKAPFKQFMGFSLLDDMSQSFAICPNYLAGECAGEQLINISGSVQQPGQLALSEFLTTKIRMEQKTYNKLLLNPGHQAHGDLVEEVFHGDLYFNVKDNLLVRNDFRISLLNLKGEAGLFYFASCITDEACASSPIRYEVRGNYQHSIEHWPQGKVERFDIEVTKTELSSPNKLSATAESIYFNFRKHHLTQSPLTFYRIYSDKQTAVWIIPIADANMVWMQKQLLRL